MTPIDIYLNFVLLAIHGQMAKADLLMKVGGKWIREVAAELHRAYPIPVKTIYRGVLLDPRIPFKLDSRLTFMSWSEKESVARWFACRESIVSLPLAELNPSLRGFVASFLTTTPNSRVLFHHSWAKEFPFEACARRHPSIDDEGCRQIAWSLCTQAEVITEPIEDLSFEQVWVGVIEAQALDAELVPPWLMERVLVISRRGVDDAL